ncbi:MAG: MoaD/ThiS family protein [Alphaproteobacteria bacterium]|nr:MoaD/ThiS family protein [Alphaproteobacteria bacterium]
MAQILYFGRLADVCGARAETVVLPAGVSDTQRLRDWLDHEKDAGGALRAGSVRLCINDEMVNEPSAVSNDDTIAFLPPVGGG